MTYQHAIPNLLCRDFDTASPSLDYMTEGGLHLAPNMHKSLVNQG